MVCLGAVEANSIGLVHAIVACCTMGVELGKPMCVHVHPLAANIGPAAAGSVGPIPLPLHILLPYNILSLGWG